MIDCPDCGKAIRGKICSCGWEFKRQVHDGWEHRKQRDKFQDDSDHLASCRTWLNREGITTEGMTTGERMRAMAAFRMKISHEPTHDPLDWARILLARFADGEFILPIQERMAKEALGVQN